MNYLKNCSVCGKPTPECYSLCLDCHIKKGNKEKIKNVLEKKCRSK